MKFSTILLVILLTSITATFAQKSGLINSGELLKQGAILHDSSEYKKALQLYDKISRSDTNYVRSLYERALTCEADSQYNQAIAYCREGLALKDQREFEPDLYTIYGSTLSDMKKYDEAIKVFDQGIAKYPQTALLYFNKGIALIGQARYADAEAVFQQTAIINPYLYSTHYQLAYTALQQGKLLPAFISCVGYLLMSPQGRYFSKSINILNQISTGTDEILGFKNKRAQAPDMDYQMVEEIVLSKIALDKQYKPIITLDDPISRQIQVVFEKMEYDSQSKDFYMQYYLPYFKQVFKSGKFELLVNSAFSNANVAVIKDFNTKNKKAIDAFLNEAGVYFNNIRATRVLKYADRDTVTNRYLYEDGKLVGKGVLVNSGKTLNGAWKFYYPAGNLKGKGQYNQTGERTGDFMFYSFNGNLKSKEHYENGKSNGPQEYYYSNGNQSSHEVEVNGQLEGFITTWYYGGAKKMEATYKAGKKDGLEKIFYENGNLKSVTNYVNGVQNGPAKEYYKNGSLKNAGIYVNGKTDGPFKTYYENGALSAEMTFTKEKVEGPYNTYYENGKPKEKRNYVADAEDGLHQAYYENGQLSETFTAKKGKINGEAIYYSKTGKVYSSIVYDNGVIRSAKYFDPSGKQLSASVLKNDLIDIVSYTPEGFKKGHFTYDNKGDLTGPDTLFYPSGKVHQVSQYVKGKANGLSVTYYLNGQKKSEINMADDTENGYYQGYYVNGQLEAEGWIREGDYQGEWAYHDMQGKITSKLYYEDSQLNGYKEEFGANGKKTLEQKYDSGLLEKMIQYDDNGKAIAVDSFPKGAGRYTLLYPSGKVRAQGNYINGTLNGVYKTLYFDGSLESSMFYKAGQIDSTYTIYYYGGTKFADRKYSYGSRTGIWKSYNEDGSLANTTVYANDAANGERIYYNEDGSKDFVTTYKDDVIDGMAQKFDIDGKLAYQVLFDNDAIVSYSYQDKDGKMVPFIPVPNVNGQFKSYYANGNVSRECGYSDGVKNGKMKLYYSNGQLRSEDDVVYGANHGISREYYPDGKPMSETHYVYDNRDGVAKEYYKNGNLKKETEYLNGNNHGPAKYYDQNGKLTKTLVYNYGDLISVKNEK